MKSSEPKIISVVVFKFVLVLVSIGPTACRYISPYSQFAYEQATSLKVEALALMDKATEPYANHEKEVEQLQTKIEKAYEYVKGQPANELSTKQWEILKNPERHLLGGFLKRWKEKSTLSSVFIKEAKGVVADAFDTISGLESGKIKRGEVQ